jgi:hypothetical protein
VASTRARTLRHGRVDNSPLWGTGHRLRLRLAALVLSMRAHGGQRSPGPTKRARQARHRPWAWPTPTLMWCLPMAAQQGQELGAAFGHGYRFSYPDDPGADIGRGADDGNMVDQGAGADDAAAVG